MKEFCVLLIVLLVNKMSFAQFPCVMEVSDLGDSTFRIELIDSSYYTPLFEDSEPMRFNVHVKNDSIISKALTYKVFGCVTVDTLKTEEFNVTTQKDGNNFAIYIRIFEGYIDRHYFFEGIFIQDKKTKMNKFLFDGNNVITSPQYLTCYIISKGKIRKEIGSPLVKVERKR